MKRTNMTLWLTFMLLISFAVPSRASYSAPAPDAPVNSPVIPADTRAAELMHRLTAIKAMDRSGLSKLERKAIRKEVVAIRKEMKKLSGGIYLSIGAIILIVLLILIL